MDLSNWTPEQLLQALGLIVTFFGTTVLTIGGWFVVARLNRAQTDKAKAETQAIYQDMTHQAADQERKLTERLAQVERAAAEREAAQQKRIDDLTNELSKVKEALAEKVEENSNLQRQIAELKVQTDDQAQELQTLREELQTLRMKRKQ